MADALSRCHEPNSLYVISFYNPAWVDQLKLGYQDDQDALTILASTPKDYSVKDGIIRHKGRIWLGNNELAKQHVLQAVHSSAVGGHSRVQATYYRIKSLFSWPGMKAAIQKYIQECQVCQQAKGEHIKSPGLQPLPVPEQAWQIVCMDFVEGLPKS